MPATGIASVTQATSTTGTAGNIMIRAGSLSILNKGGIASGTSGSANSGNISVDVAGQLAIDQTSATGIKLGVILGIEFQANPGSTGNAGDVTVNAGAMSIRNTGQGGSPTYGAGNGGNVSVNVTDQLNIDGSGNTTQFLTGIGASVQPGSRGNAGSVDVAAGTLRIVDGVIFNAAVGAIAPAPASTGNAGKITVKVDGSLSIDGSGAGIITGTDVGTVGNAGDVSVTAGTLSIANSGTITASTAGSGRGGSVTVNAEDADPPYQW